MLLSNIIGYIILIFLLENLFKLAIIMMHMTDQIVLLCRPIYHIILLYKLNYQYKYLDIIKIFLYFLLVFSILSFEPKNYISSIILNLENQVIN